MLAIRFGLILCLFMLATSERCSAGVWNEFGDAGELLITATPSSNPAQVTVGAGVLDEIIGTYSGINDVDTFLIKIDTAGTLTAAVTPSTSAAYLFLFNGDGIGVAAVEPSTTLSVSGLDIGLYYLAISQWKYPVHDGVSPSNIFGISGVSATDPLYAWVEPVGDSPTESESNEYSINLTGATFAVSNVPEPTSLAMWGILGVAALGIRRRVKR